MDRGETKQSLVSPLLFLRILNRFGTEEEWEVAELDFPDTSAIEEDLSMRFLVNPDDFIFEVSGENSLSVDVTSGGTGETSISVVSTLHGENTGFTVSEKPDWVTVSTGESSINYQIPSNPEMTERTGNVVLVQESSEKEIVITFTQAKGLFYEFTISGETSHQIEATSDETGQIGLNIVSTRNGENIGFSVDNPLDWVSVTTGETSLNYQIKENTGNIERNGTVTLSQAESGKKITISFRQKVAEYEFNISGKTSYQVNAESVVDSGQVTLNITSTKNGKTVGFTVENSLEWVSITTGETSLNYQLSENASISERSGNVTLTQVGSNNKITVLFTQKAAKYEFNISGKTSYQVNAESVVDSGQVTLNITSTRNGKNIGFSVDNPLEWVSVTTGATSLNYRLTENASISERSGNVTLTQIDSNNKITVSFTQKAANYEFNISGGTVQSLLLEGEETSGTVNVTSTENNKLIGYSINGTPSWMTANRSSGDNSLNYSATANYGENQRSGTLTLVQDKTSKKVTINVSQEHTTIKASAAQIVLWDANQNMRLVVNAEDYNTSAYPTTNFTPIGVVVIPSSHMDDGRARMMSTRWMSCDDPENGSLTASGMVWGIDTDLSGLTNFTALPILESAIEQTIERPANEGYLPSDDPTWTGETNPQDLGTKWFFDESPTISFIPSPYAFDGTPNPLYRATEYSGGTINNLLSDFDGRHQTDVILSARGEKDYSSWKPGSETPEDYPAASCCDMYHTVGTSQGEWYLPTVAEFGYAIARLNSIKSALIKIDGIQELKYDDVCFTSEFNETYIWYVTISNGLVNFLTLKHFARRNVIAFCAV